MLGGNDDVSYLSGLSYHDIVYDVGARAGGKGEGVRYSMTLLKVGLITDSSNS